MSDLISKKPHEVFKEIVAYLEQKGLPDHEIYKFIEELEPAVKDELAIELAKKSDMNSFEQSESQVPQMSDDQLASLLGLDDEIIDSALVAILEKYKQQLHDTLSGIPDANRSDKGEQ
jgi:hypothetical protein